VEASDDSPFPYFRGKARVEEIIRESGLGYMLVRPTVIFGMEDILINNIAYILRRVPVFGIPGRARPDSGRSRSSTRPRSAFGRAPLKPTR
jgi:NADH dehydrogenase